MPIPWDKVILHGPQVLDVAKTLYGKWQSRPKQTEPEPASHSENSETETQLNSLRLQLKLLEDAGEKQAALATELAEQTQALSIGVTALKEWTESLEKEIETLETAHADVSRRLHELQASLRQANAANSSLNRRIAIALLISSAALILSAVVLAKLLTQ